MSWLGKKSGRKKKPGQAGLADRLFRLKRLFPLLAGALLFVWLISWLWLGGFITQGLNWTQAQFYEVSAQNGFAVEEIVIEGVTYADHDSIKALLNIRRGESIFALDPSSAQGLIEQISWVATAQISRQLPNRILVRIDERLPVAFYQNADQKLFVVDPEGVKLTSENLVRFKGGEGLQKMLTFYGDGALDHLWPLLQLLAAEPEIYAQLSGAAYIGQRRWDLLSANGIRIQLPEDDPGYALRRLALADAENQILRRKLERIDLRQPDRMILQTARGNVEDLIPLLSDPREAR